jgi:CBS domain-containing protein
MEVEAILRAKGSTVHTVPTGALVVAAVESMHRNQVGALVVTDGGDRIAGMLSERDIVTGLCRHGAELLGRRVAEVMDRHVTTCRPGDSIDVVMEQMTRTRRRHVPVVDDGRLVGIVSIGDIVKRRVDELSLEARVLRDVYLASH